MPGSQVIYSSSQASTRLKTSNLVLLKYHLRQLLWSEFSALNTGCLLTSTSDLPLLCTLHTDRCLNSVIVVKICVVPEALSPFSVSQQSSVGVSDYKKNESSAKQSLPTVDCPTRYLLRSNIEKCRNQDVTLS